MKRKVLITGATGETGHTAVTESIRRGLDVRAMVHARDDRFAALEKQGAEIVTGDLHEIDTIRQAMEGAVASHIVYPVNLGWSAREAGVGAVVNLSQRSASRTSRSDSCRDTWVAEQVLNWSGLLVTHLRPTCFLELLHPWQLPLLREGILRLPVGKGRHAPIAAEDQGRVIAALLEKPAGHEEGRTYPLFGPAEMDHDQKAAEVTGGSSLRTLRSTRIAIGWS